MSIGAAAWAASKAVGSDVGVVDADIAGDGLVDGRAAWLALGAYEGAVFAMNALFVGRPLRFGPEDTLAVNDLLRWAWAALLLVSAIAVAVRARRALQHGASRRRWLACLAVGLAVSAPLFLVAVKTAWTATRAVGLPPVALAPVITLLWATLTLVASASLLGLEKAPAAAD